MDEPNPYDLIISGILSESSDESAELFESQIIALRYGNPEHLEFVIRGMIDTLDGLMEAIVGDDMAAKIALLRGAEGNYEEFMSGVEDD